MLTGPRAFSGSRLGWGDLPRAVRSRIVRRLGAEVVSEASATSGFSPGYAATLELGDGRRVFLKAVSPDQNPDSPVLARREAEVNRLLPPEAQAPELLWSDDDGRWVVLCFAFVAAASPSLPWRPAELQRALDAVGRLGRTPAPGGLRPLSAATQALFTGWSQLAQSPDDVDRAAEALPEHGAWLRSHLTDLVVAEAGGVAATEGDRLVHLDVRADNLLLDRDHVWFVDWPHASAGCGWFDLMAFLPSVAMQGGGRPQELFRTDPLAAGADPGDVVAALAGLAGFFVRSAVQPPPPAIPNLRAFQREQGRHALAWLRAELDADAADAGPPPSTGPGLRP